MISVIIPAYNEAVCISATIRSLRRNDEHNLIKEIIIADGGSTDNTASIANTEGVKTVIARKKGRASQMNFGASLAKGKIFYFLHADTLPPKHFTVDIAHAVEQGYGAGCYKLVFDLNHWFLKASCWLTRFDVDAIRFGDQSLFVTKDAFLKVGGFCEQHMVLEDQQMIKRLKRITQFVIIKKSVTTSARKYRANGIYRTQCIFFIIYLMYQLGFPQQKLVATYRKLIVQSKI